MSWSSCASIGSNGSMPLSTQYHRSQVIATSSLSSGLFHGLDYALIFPEKPAALVMP
jgi:hypothetical protein